MTTGEETKGRDIERAGNQGDGVQVSVIMRVTMVTGVRHNEHPGDLETGEGAHVTITTVYLCVYHTCCDLYKLKVQWLRQRWSIYRRFTIYTLLQCQKVVRLDFSNHIVS